MKSPEITRNHGNYQKSWKSQEIITNRGNQGDQEAVCSTLEF
jgi:hypothetical protein